MPALAPGEARRLTPTGPPRRLIAAICAAFVACTGLDLPERARHDDAAHGTAVFTWAYDHDPARIDVWHLDPAAIGGYLRDGRARAVSGSVDAACRAARGDRALLLVVAPAKSAARERALDCGFPVERDAFAVVIAPR